MTSNTFELTTRTIYNNFNLTITENKFDYKYEFIIKFNNKIIHQISCETWDIKEYAEYDSPETSLINDLLASAIVAITEKYPC